ncbi:MAG: hypothetical protein JO305_02915 [Alphaproteobacteria bacterium]|nr:hypothetical protein [Alphaproteobacteria bacterium]
MAEGGIPPRYRPPVPAALGIILVLLGLAIAGGAAWLAVAEWDWLSLPLDRRTEIARTIIDRWEGSGAYRRIDAENGWRFAIRRY